MTSDARATTLIQRRFLDEWPLVAIGVACAIGGPATPPVRRCLARLQVWCGQDERRGWIHLGMWIPAPIWPYGGDTLVDAARHVFDGVTIATDDGIIVVDRGVLSEGSIDGEHWVLSAQWSFQLQ